MDPLSFAASIIALLQAAQVTAQVIEKLCRYFDAPEIILQLLNEVRSFNFQNGCHGSCSYFIGIRLSNCPCFGARDNETARRAVSRSG